MKTPPNLTEHVQVDRAFYFEGKVQKVGAVLEVPKRLASDLVTANKAHLVTAPVAAPAPAGTDKAGKKES